MGNSQSNHLKKICLGKSNSHTPDILRFYNIDDHLFPYDLQTIEYNPYPKLNFASKMAKVNKIIQNNLNVSPRQSFLDYEKVCGENLFESFESTYRDALRKNCYVKHIVSDKKNIGQQIYLCRRFLIELSDEIQYLENIKIFQVCCNYLETIPSAIGKLHNLQILILARNKINKLPDEIGHLVNLRELNLSQNELSSLPNTIVALKKLETLHLDCNKFFELPETIGRLVSLRYLNISRNYIKYIPIEILQLPNLSELDCSWCDFTEKTPVKTIKKNNFFSLKEICSRRMFISNLPIYKYIDSNLRNHIMSVKECSYCTGPYFESYIEHQTTYTFLSNNYPVKYKLCSLHFKTKSERNYKLFFNASKSFPSNLIADGLPPVSEVFNILCYNKRQILLYRDYLNNQEDYDSLVPLFSLNRFTDIPNWLDYTNESDNNGIFRFL
ncbi:leucine-rich repeat-containing protein [Hamiltosporidium tvaerminnensis]|uniref:Leucine-rich repeat-containing protein n=1 Tax=Hamiltosporidium tvaerminnensis TaxID=1176355 RepID=A0A4Q9M300_9MICR|nr:leucine-rich repeat-containing protein [Hamiltosporidium tvaerminnensis]